MSVAIADTVLDLLGATPIVRLRKFAAVHGVAAELYLKLEYQNPGGSHKARIAHNMVLRAEARGDLTRGSGQTILEPTGGNTGMGLAIVCKVYGYKLVLVVPDNYSVEKRRALELYGARIILSDSTRGGNSHGELASELLLQHPDWVMLNQQRNPANPAVHFDTTAPEILAAFAGRAPLNFFVGGIGTGGHITGVGSRLKEKWPRLKVVAVQPEGCDFRSAQFSQHKIQGLAVGLVPANLRMDVVDEFRTVTYEEACSAVRALIDAEGIGVGLSTGANLVACLNIARAVGGGAILCPAYDSVSHYLEHFEPPPARAEAKLECAK